jgi:hypothetical protein
MSQFSVSYGMVLNLLSTRRLRDCEQFLARSFLRFQTAGNVEETVAEAQRLESEAERILRKLEGGGDEELGTKFAAAQVCTEQLVCYSVPCPMFCLSACKGVCVMLLALQQLCPAYRYSANSGSYHIMSYLILSYHTVPHHIYHGIEPAASKYI